MVFEHGMNPLDGSITRRVEIELHCPDKNPMNVKGTISMVSSM
jgi:hypothetical protein